MKLTSNQLKLAVMAFYRFKKGYLTTTELSYTHGIADVIAINDKTGEVIEIEIKISKQDLLKEKEHKADKHKALKEAEITTLDVYNKWDNTLICPNKFYLCVPKYLVEDAIAFCVETNKDYGVLSFEENYRKNPEHTIRYQRQAHKLHSEQVCHFFKPLLYKRVMNDNIVFWKKMYWVTE